MLPAANRLPVRDLQATLQQGKRIGGSAVVVAIRRVALAQPPQFGIICGKRVGNAPTRNLVRRRLREISRLTLATWLPLGTQLVIRALPAANGMSYLELETELTRVVKRATSAIAGW